MNVTGKRQIVFAVSYVLPFLAHATTNPAPVLEDLEEVEVVMATIIPQTTGITTIKIKEEVHTVQEFPVHHSLQSLEAQKHKEQQFKIL